MQLFFASTIQVLALVDKATSQRAAVSGARATVTQTQLNLSTMRQQLASLEHMVAHARADLERAQLEAQASILGASTTMAPKQNAVQHMTDMNKIVSSLGGVRVTGAVAGPTLTLDVECHSQTVTLRVHRETVTQRYLGAELSVAVPVTDVIDRFLATQQVSFLVREVRARVDSWAARTAQLEQLLAMYVVLI